MSNKILSITRKATKEDTLPDGLYSGIWGGSIIEVKYNGNYYELGTENGVRGIGYKVVVTIIEGVATFKEINN